MPQLAAVLMAGGASRRMGQPKAFLNYNGLPLWRHQLSTLQRLAPSELLISSSPRLNFEPGPWTLVRDRAPHLGPLAGLEAALLASSAQQLVVLAVDMPGITTSFLKTLLTLAGKGGVVPQLDHFYSGTVAIYPRAIQPLVEQVLASPDRSFQHLIRLALARQLMMIYPVPEQERELFRNLNTPADLDLK